MAMAAAIGMVPVLVLAGSCATDCRVGSAPARPVIYFEWKGLSLEQCCARCAANSTCAFALHRAADGACWPAPGNASAFRPNAAVTTCRTAKAPAWPSPHTPTRQVPDLHPALWPMVRGAGSSTVGATHTPVSATFAATCSTTVCPNASTLEWYASRIRNGGITSGGISGVVLTVTAHGMLGPRMNESYRLECVLDGCTITAPETVGALRGLETLAHFAYATANTSLPLPLTVVDSPAFPYRGLLIDSARHFLPVRVVKRMLDGMSTCKLSVLHWHLSDSNAFPVQSTLFPSLSGKGAMHPRAVYTKEELRGVVAYAAERGVRIVPEYDVSSPRDPHIPLFYLAPAGEWSV